MEVFKVSIPNWDKYNERADRGNYIWFRFQNNFFFDQTVFGLSESTQLLFIFLLCEASKRNGDQFEMRMDYLSTLRKKKPEQISEQMDELSDCGLILLSREFPADDGKFLPTERTDGTEQNNIAHSVRFDFEAIYKKYPRKVGKGKGLTRAKAQVKTEADYQALSAAVDRYAAYCRKQGTEPQFIKHFSTFMGEWRDWIDADTGTAATVPLGTLSSCGECKGGAFTAINKSTGGRELVACSCASGKLRNHIPRFDENRFERVVA